MSFELKSSRHKSKWTSFNRSAINKRPGNKLPMRLQGDIFSDRYSATLRRGIIKRFLMSRVGKDYEEVRNEFRTLTNKQNFLPDTVKWLDYYVKLNVDDTNRNLNFELKDGILCYRDKKTCKNKNIRAHEEYNKKNIRYDVLEKLKSTLIYGPIPIGTLWVKWHGNTMKLPVHLVSEIKFRTAHNRKLKYHSFTKSSLDNLLDYETVAVESRFYSNQIAIKRNWSLWYEYGDYIVYYFIVKRSDIENLKKEKVS